MKHRSIWTRTALAGALALATLGAPLATAGDRCDRPSYSRDDRAYYRDNRGYGAGSYSAYRDSSYRGYNNGYRDNGYRYQGGSYGYNEYRGERSAGKSAAIVGGGAVAGAVIGGLTGGGKGAAIGAAVGGIGGLVVDQATRNNSNNSYRRR